MFESLGFVSVTPLQGSVLLGAIIRLAFGVLAQRTRFCFRRSVVGEDRRQALGVWLMALALAVVGTQGAVAAGLISFDAHRFMAGDLPFLAIALGGLMFGTGMVLTRGCISRLTVLGGGGNLRGLLVVLVFAVVAHATLKGVLAPLRVALGSVTVPLGEAVSLAALPGGALLWSGLIALAALAYALRSGNRPGQLVMAALIGLLVPADWVGPGFVLLDEFDPIAMESLSFTAPAADTLFWTLASSSIPAGFGTGLLGGVLAGALVTSLIAGEFRWQSFENPRQTGRYLSGAGPRGLGGGVGGGAVGERPRARGGGLEGDLGDRSLGPEGAGEEGLIGTVGLVEREVLFLHRDAVRMAKVDDLLTGHAVHAVIPGRGPNLAPAHDEEVAGIGGVHKAIDVEHQRLIRTGFLRRDAGKNAVKLGVGVQLGVLRHRQAANVRHGRQPDWTRDRRFGMFHDDGERWPLLGQRGGLKRAGFHAARDHQAGVGIGGHLIGGASGLQGCNHAGFVHADVQIDGFGGLKQAVHMLVQEGPVAVIKPQPFPHAIPEHKTAVIDRHHCPRLGHTTTVKPDLDLFLAGVTSALVDGDALGPGTHTMAKARVDICRPGEFHD